MTGAWKGLFLLEPVPPTAANVFSAARSWEPWPGRATRALVAAEAAAPWPRRADSAAHSPFARSHT